MGKMSRGETNILDNKFQKKLTITVPEAAKMLGISRGLAYEMAREGAIPTLRFGRRMVVPRAAIERLLEETNATALHHSVEEVGRRN